MTGFFFSSRRRHTRLVSDWSSDVCSSDLVIKTDDTEAIAGILARREPAQSDPATGNPQTGVRASPPMSGNFAPHEAPQSQVKPDPQSKNNHLDRKSVV